MSYRRSGAFPLLLGVTLAPLLLGAVEAGASFQPADTTAAVGTVRDALRERYVERVGRLGNVGRRDSPFAVRDGRGVSSRCVADDGDVCHGGDWALALCEANVSCHEPPDETLGVLLEAAAAHPGSGFVVGQAVGAAVRTGRLLDAFEAAEACAAAEWFCLGLQGHVFVAAGRHDQAEERFRRMLAEAPDSVACGLTDPAGLVGARDRVDTWDSDHVQETWRRDPPCPTPAARADTLWWLSDPLHALVGNDRWVAHVDRGIGLRIHRELFGALPDNLRDLPFGAAVAGWPAFLRRGPWDSWQHDISERGISSLQVWTGDAAAAQHFVPDLVDQDGSRAVWRLDAGVSYEGLSVPYGPVRSLDAQVARFRRLGEAGGPGSLRLAVAASVAGTALGALADSAYLVVSDGPGDPALQLQAPFRDGRTVFLAEAPESRYVVSLEVVEPDAVGRYREMTPPPPAGLSDVLLYRPVGFEAPDSLLAAVASMLGAPTVEADAPELGLYWEVYGARPGSMLEMELELERDEGGLIDRLRRLLPGGPEEASGTLGWTTEADGALTSLATILDLRAVAPGRYTLVLRVRTDDGARHETRRALRIAPS